jgi:O-antigen/teichoic acid export membrane protein
VIVWASPIVHLALGPSYEDSAAVLRALAPFVFLSGLGTYITITVNYLGEARRRVPLAIVTVLLNVVLDLILLPSIGVVGGAIATDVAFAVFAAGHFWICWDALRFPVRPLTRSLVRVLGAAAAMAGVLALFGTTSLSAAEWIAGSVAAVAAYALALRLLGEVTGAEVAQARDAIRGFLARNRPLSG